MSEEKRAFGMTREDFFALYRSKENSPYPVNENAPYHDDGETFASFLEKGCDLLIEDCGDTIRQNLI